LRLEPPPNCPPKFAQLMHWCWEANPEKRPDFKQIAEQLEIISAEVDNY